MRIASAVLTTTRGLTASCSLRPFSVRNVQLPLASRIECPIQLASAHTMLDGETEILERDRTEENRTVIKNMIDSLFIRGEADKLASFIDEKTYIQHNPGQVTASRA